MSLSTVDYTHVTSPVSIGLLIGHGIEFSTSHAQFSLIKKGANTPVLYPNRRTDEHLARWKKLPEH